MSNKNTRRRNRGEQKKSVSDNSIEEISIKSNDA
jgi:hypothetical protein